MFLLSCLLRPPFELNLQALRLNLELKVTLLGTLGALLGALGVLLGRSWALLGRCWCYIGEVFKKIRFWKQMLDSTWEAKWMPKSLKIDVKSQYVFRHLFFTIFFNFSLILEVEFRWFFDGFLDLKRKRRFCKN